VAASAFALFSIETKYGFENVFRISATFTLLPLALLELLELLAAAGAAELLLELLELLEPQAATVRAATAAHAAVARRRLRRAFGRSEKPEWRSWNIKSLSSSYWGVHRARANTRHRDNDVSTVSARSEPVKA